MRIDVRAWSGIACVVRKKEVYPIAHRPRMLSQTSHTVDISNTTYFRGINLELWVAPIPGRLCFTGV